MGKSEIIKTLDILTVKSISRKIICILMMCFIFLFVSVNYKADEVIGNTQLYTMVPASETVTGEDTCISVTSYGEDQFLVAVNQERASYGIASLQTNDFWTTQAMARAGDDAENYIRGETSALLSHNTDKYYGQAEESLAGGSEIATYDALLPYNLYLREKQYVPDGLVEEMVESDMSTYYSVDHSEGDSAVGDTIFAGIGGNQIGHYLAMVDIDNTYVGSAAALIDSGCDSIYNNVIYATLYGTHSGVDYFNAGDITVSGTTYSTYENDLAQANYIDGVDASKLKYNVIRFPDIYGDSSDTVSESTASSSESTNQNYSTSPPGDSSTNTVNNSNVQTSNTDSNTKQKEKKKKEAEKKKKEAEKKKKAEEKAAAELKETTMARTEGIDTLVSTKEVPSFNILYIVIIFSALYWSISILYLIVVKRNHSK